MKTEHSPAVQPMPAVTDLGRAMRLLGVPIDPMYVMKDHPDKLCRTEMLARIAAWSTVLLQRAASLAELSTDDLVDLHGAADRDVTGPSGRPYDAGPELNLQIARLAWAHHSISRTRREGSSRAHDPAATVISTARADHAGITSDTGTGRSEHGVEQEECDDDRRDHDGAGQGGQAAGEYR